MGKAKTDEELTDLLTMLYTMQEDVGAKPKTTDDEKKNKAANIAMESMGRTKKANKTGSRFLELKSSIVDRLKEIQGQLREIKERETHWGGDNPKEVIRLQAEIRENLRQAQDEWKEMDALYKNEARKKRSKFSPEELEIQATLVMRLHQEIEKVKQLQMRGFQRGGAAAAASGLNTQTISAFDSIPAANVAGSGASSWQKGGSGGGGVAVTSDQQMQLQQLEERDQDFDQQLDELGEGIQDLAEIAKLQGEEVKRQNVMLDNVGNKIDSAAEHVNTVNARMKETLDEVGRSSDKLCVDIMCIVLAVGFGAVFYNMAR